MPELKLYLQDLIRVNDHSSDRRQYLRLDMNESVDGLPEEFVKRVLSDLDSTFLATYPQYDDFQTILADHVGLKPENICLSNGSDAAIKYIFEAYVSPGDRVLITDPTFAMYPVYSKMFAVDMTVVPYDSRMMLPVSLFCQMLCQNIKLAVIVNPNNPTGSIVSRSDLIKIMDKAEQEDVLLIIDEAYYYYYPDTVVNLVTKYKNLIILRTFSKLCGIAASRLGYAAACSDIIENLRKVKPTYDVNAFAVTFAEKLLQDNSLIPVLVSSVNEGKRYVSDRLTSEGIDYVLGHANFILIKCGARVQEIQSKLQERGILVAGGFKQELLKPYLRVTLGKTETMKVFLDNFIDLWTK